MPRGLVYGRSWYWKLDLTLMCVCIQMAVSDDGERRVAVKSRFIYINFVNPLSNIIALVYNLSSNVV